MTTAVFILKTDLFGKIFASIYILRLLLSGYSFKRSDNGRKEALKKNYFRLVSIQTCIFDLPVCSILFLEEIKIAAQCSAVY
jgi:hypothetical protein